MATFGPSTSTGDVIAVAQMNSTNSKTENLETCKTLISRAVEQGAKVSKTEPLEVLSAKLALV